MFRAVSIRGVSSLRLGAQSQCRRLEQHLTAAASSTTRLFAAGPRRGEIDYFDEQTALPQFNEKKFRETIHEIAELIGYPTYHVSVILVDDDEMTEINRETRGIDRPTDILSFPFHEAVRPGLLKEPEFDIPDYYTLGEMIIDVPYVIRRCEEDREYYESADAQEGDEVDSESGGGDDDECEYEYEDDDRGVSGAMATVYDPEIRCRMLLVHGMLHLVGHDHEKDDDYELMVSEEERILKQLGFLSEDGDVQV